MACFNTITSCFLAMMLTVFNTSSGCFYFITIRLFTFIFWTSVIFYSLTISTMNCTVFRTPLAKVIHQRHITLWMNADLNALHHRSWLRRLVVVFLAVLHAFTGCFLVIASGVSTWFPAARLIINHSSPQPSAAACHSTWLLPLACRGLAAHLLLPSYSAPSEIHSATPVG